VTLIETAATVDRFHPNKGVIMSCWSSKYSSHLALALCVLWYPHHSQALIWPFYANVRYWIISNNSQYRMNYWK
jgi:hypothetical protein